MYWRNWKKLTHTYRYVLYVLTPSHCMLAFMLGQSSSMWISCHFSDFVSYVLAMVLILICSNQMFWSLYYGVVRVVAFCFISFTDCFFYLLAFPSDCLLQVLLQLVHEVPYTQVVLLKITSRKLTNRKYSRAKIYKNTYTYGYYMCLL